MSAWHGERVAGGVCEAYPLAQASAENGNRAVRLYIDEIGALRGRPRNARAEALAAAAGLAGLSIHGDAFVGRTEGGAAAVRNVDFDVGEMAHDASWVAGARAAHGRAAAEANFRSDEHLAKGSADAEGGNAKYEWSQTDEEVEVSVVGAPSGKGASRRVKVSYGKGESLSVDVDGSRLLHLSPLFDRVVPDGCSWSIDGERLSVSLEKATERPWPALVLAASAATGGTGRIKL